MTTIIMLREDGILYTAYNQMGETDGYIHESSPKVRDFETVKVYGTRDRIVVGISGSGDIGWSLFDSHSFKDLLASETLSLEFLNTQVGPWMYNRLKERGLLINSGGQEYADFTSIWASLRGNYFYQMSTKLVAHCHYNNYIALGSGVYYALGSLATTQNLTMGPSDRVNLAMKVTRQYDPYSSGKIVRINYDDPSGVGSSQYFVQEDRYEKTWESKLKITKD